MVKKIASLFVGIVFTFLVVHPAFAYYNNMPASVVVGQTDFTSTTGGTSQTKLNNSAIRGVFVDSHGRLIVADQNNHRVLIWNSVPTTNGAPADIELGQPDFNASTADNGGRSNITFNAPDDVFSTGDKLVVSEDGSSRVLIWNTFPTQNRQPADVVLGRTSFSDSTGNVCDNLHVGSVQGVSIFNNKLIVASRNQNRVLIWNSVPTTSSVAPDVVVGQADFTHCTALAAAANTLSDPRGVQVDSNGRLIVGDRGNRRILIWNSIPANSSANADIVIGQPDFVTGSATTANLNTVGSLIRLYSNGTRLFIPSFNRVSIYNSISGMNNPNADIVLGQTSFTASSANGGGSTSATGFNGNNAIFEYDNKLFVADESNARILIFNNVLTDPKIAINAPSLLTDSRLKVTGNIKVGERSRYSLQTLKSQINNEGLSDVTYRDGGRDDGLDSTVYEFYHEFSPWAGNGTKDTWQLNGYTLKFKVTNNNADEESLFYFYPFNLISANGNLFKFSAPKAHWQRLKDNLNSFVIKYKMANADWITLENGTKLTDSIFDSSTGQITIKTQKTLPLGVTSVKIVAKDNWGHEQLSSLFSLTPKSTLTPANLKQNLLVSEPTPTPDSVSTDPQPGESEAINKTSFIYQIFNSIKAFFLNILSKI